MLEVLAAFDRHILGDRSFFKHPEHLPGDLGVDCLAAERQGLPHSIARLWGASVIEECPDDVPAKVDVDEPHALSRRCTQSRALLYTCVRQLVKWLEGAFGANLFPSPGTLTPMQKTTHKDSLATPVR